MEILNNEEKIISDCIKLIKKEYKDRNDGYDFNHSMRVYNLAKEIIERDYSIREINKLNVYLAALLHEIDYDNRYFEFGSKFLKKYDIKEGPIIYIIDQAKNKNKKVETIEAAVVQDADILDGIGAIGIARTFMFNAVHRNKQEEAIRHFYNDTLLSSDKLNTNAAKYMAEKRHKILEDFISQYLDEDTISTCNHRGMIRFDEEASRCICLNCGKEFNNNEKW